jgi:DNA transformation protein and related proteins
MSANPVALSELPNLGKKIVQELRAIGIASVQQLARIGAAAAYHRLCERAGKRLPRCYYLYSLEGALRGIHWSTLGFDEKQRLSAEAAALRAGARRRAALRSS